MSLEYLFMKSKMTESFRFSAVLSLSGGLQDAYTYNLRDGVFANAQTGNVVLMSQHLMQGDLKLALHYLGPLLSFALGILLAEMIGHDLKKAKKITWQQVILFLEICLLFVVGFLPTSVNMLANALVSLSCAMQVQGFRKVHDFPYASTMCIGHLRRGMESFSVYLREKEKNMLMKALHYFGIIFIFAFGAGLGGILSRQIGMKTIWISCILLLFDCLFLFREVRIPNEV
ncbi:MAG: DUF1275 domain-containing protein [Lachnospiraceae bacterium]|nr:DUF1275 domain-containing protein [Lachnospiraceae bacterium]